LNSKIEQRFFEHYLEYFKLAEDRRRWNLWSRRGCFIAKRNRAILLLRGLGELTNLLRGVGLSHLALRAK